MTAKNQTDWSVEKLKKWAKPALKYSKLVEIACTAASNTEAKDKALEFTKEQGLEEKIAMACRWLRILRAKLSEEEFEDYLAENQSPRKVASQPRGKKSEGKGMETHCFYCCRQVVMKNPKAITLDDGKSGFLGKCPNCGKEMFRVPRKEKEMGEKKIKILLHDPEVELDSVNAVRICNAILSKIATTDIVEELKFSPRFDYQYEQNHLRDLMIQVLKEEYGMEPFIKALEEKGLRVKICGNCEHCLPQYDPNHMGFCLHKRDSQKLFEGACYIDNGFESCKHWAPKEVSGKQEVVEKSKNKEEKIVAYCYKCRSKREMKGAIKKVKIGADRNCPALEGKCSNCGEKIHKIV